MKQTLKLFGLLLIMAFSFTASSCSDDKNDEPSASASLVGTWTYEESYSKDVDAGFKMVLTFNKDYTGTVSEEFYANETRASEHYSMKFSWSTSTDSQGNDILRVSYVSGDRDVTLFPQDDDDKSSNIVLWNRKYVLTGKILNIYQGAGVWVFNKK